MRPRSDSGFTLVELLAVVAILALLAVFAVPKAYNAMISSRQGKAAHDLKAIQDALENHYADLGYYPVKLNDLVAAGYVKRGVSFRSPASKQWYFYAVDDNHDKAPRAYILGDPGPNPGPSVKLYHRLPLPAGRSPTQRAIPWVRFDSASGNSMLYLYADDDATPWQGPLPTALDLYRIGCRPETPEPCDVVTN